MLQVLCLLMAMCSGAPHSFDFGTISPGFIKTKALSPKLQVNNPADVTRLKESGIKFSVPKVPEQRVQWAPYSFPPVFIVPVPVPILMSFPVPVLKIASVPVPKSAPEPPKPSLSVSHVGPQFQDVAGQYNFSHWCGPNTRVETRDYLGRVFGSIAYFDPEGDVQVRKYAVDPVTGFHVAATDLP